MTNKGFFCIVIVIDVTTSNVSFLRGSNTQERDVTAGPLPDVTSRPRPTQLPSPTAEPAPEALLTRFDVDTSNCKAMISMIKATRFFY